jgi:lipoprotein-anchoring transpeptidase ErfK/SrfK
MSWVTLKPLVVGFSALVLLSSCRSTQPVAAPQPVAPPPIPDAYWEGDGVPGKPRIVIDLSAQRLRYYKGDQLVGMSPISSGTPNHRTPTGNFRVTEKDLNHRSSVYGDYVDASGAVVKADVDARKDARPPGSRYLGASMRYFMRFNGGIGMHEGYLPGYPASHGCVRMPTKMAAIFYSVTPHGTPVQVIGSGSNAGPQPHVPVGWSTLYMPRPAVVAAPTRPAKKERGKERERSSSSTAKKKEQGQAEASEVRKPSPPIVPPALRPGQTWYLD